MSQEAEMFKEIDSLIRAAYAELGTLQLHLIEAHERELSPTELGIHIADLGRRISTWRRERESLSRSTSAPSKTTTNAAPDGGFAQEDLSVGVAAGRRHAAPPKKKQARVADPQGARTGSAATAVNALM